MSDETGTDPAPEANATPEQEGEALKEALGDDFEDFQAFQQSKTGWDAQQNRHNEAAATAAKEAAQARDDLLKALASRELTQEQGQRPATPQEFAASLGFDPNADPGVWDEPLTLKQAYGTYRGVMDWGLNATSEVSKEISGVKAEVSGFTERFSQSEEGFAKYLAVTTIDVLEEKYPELDRDEMFEAIREGAELGDDELMGFLDRKAQSSHERMETKLSQREKARRGKRKDAPYRGAGKATAVAGEKMPADASSPDFMKQFLARNPGPSGGLADEENV